MALRDALGPRTTVRDRLIEVAEQHLREAKSAAEEAGRSAERVKSVPDEATRAMVANEAVAREKLSQAAFLLDLHVKLSRSTEVFRWWQQIVSWALGLGGLVLAGALVYKEFDTHGGWLMVVVALFLAVVASFRGPADIRFGDDPGEEAGNSGPAEGNAMAGDQGRDAGDGGQELRDEDQKPARPAGGSESPAERASDEKTPAGA